MEQLVFYCPVITLLLVIIGASVRKMTKIDESLINMNNSVNNFGDGLSKVERKVDILDGKIDDHSERLTRIETTLKIKEVK